ncbi:hypothetical protein C8R45DRAFT_1128442 [Mycena sanguinolenta]|nr:hypothetical protein C8R45DRAFT_1128442 [Mycena sanguinolenta]
MSKAHASLARSLPTGHGLLVASRELTHDVNPSRWTPTTTTMTTRLGRGRILFDSTHLSPSARIAPAYPFGFYPRLAPAPPSSKGARRDASVLGIGRSVVLVHINVDRLVPPQQQATYLYMYCTFPRPSTHDFFLSAQLIACSPHVRRPPANGMHSGSALCLGVVVVVGNLIVYFGIGSIPLTSPAFPRF